MRGSLKLNIPTQRIDLFKTRLKYSSTILWNNLPSGLQTAVCTGSEWDSYNTFSEPFDYLQGRPTQLIYTGTDTTNMYHMLQVLEPENTNNNNNNYYCQFRY